MLFFQSFSNGMFIFQLLAFLVAIVFHELAHGYVAYKLGDPTAKNQGRLTLNPISHIDPLGLILILFGPFGWAKPVQVNPLYFRNRRAGMALVAVAGPIANLVIAVLCAFLYKLFFVSMNLGDSLLIQFVYNLLRFLIGMNAMLFIFNLIPIPPLDGSKILFSFIPRSFSKQLFAIERYGPFFLLLVLITPLNQFLMPLISWAQSVVFGIVGLHVV